jgi:hypothetical protein
MLSELSPPKNRVGIFPYFLMNVRGRLKRNGKGVVMFHIVYLPVNRAWAILFGKDILTATILAIRNSKREAVQLLNKWENP